MFGYILNCLGQSNESPSLVGPTHSSVVVQQSIRKYEKPKKVFKFPIEPSQYVPGHNLCINLSELYDIVCSIVPKKYTIPVVERSYGVVPIQTPKGEWILLKDDKNQYALFKTDTKKILNFSSLVLKDNRYGDNGVIIPVFWVNSRGELVMINEPFCLFIRCYKFSNYEDISLMFNNGEPALFKLSKYFNSLKNNNSFHNLGWQEKVRKMNQMTQSNSLTYETTNPYKSSVLRDICFNNQNGALCYLACDAHGNNIPMLGGDKYNRFLDVKKGLVKTYRHSGGEDSDLSNVILFDMSGAIACDEHGEPFVYNKEDSFYGKKIYSADKYIVDFIGDKNPRIILVMGWNAKYKSLLTASVFNDGICIEVNSSMYSNASFKLHNYNTSLKNFKQHFNFLQNRMLKNVSKYDQNDCIFALIIDPENPRILFYNIETQEKKILDIHEADSLHETELKVFKKIQSLSDVNTFLTPIDHLEEHDIKEIKEQNKEALEFFTLNWKNKHSVYIIVDYVDRTYCVVSGEPIFIKRLKDGLKIDIPNKFQDVSILTY